MYRRVASVFFLFCLFIGVLAVKIAVIGETASQSVSYTSNSISLVVDRSRGMIYDCKMRPLVCEQPVKTLAVKPSDEAFVNSVSNIVPEDKNAVYEEVSHGRIGIGRALDLPAGSDCLVFEKYPRYSDDGLCVHLIGYTDSSGNGVSGIEKYYNTWLDNNSGTLKVLCRVDALRHPLKNENMILEKSSYNSPAGVGLTIDRDIQQICEDAMKIFKFDRGAIAVLDVHTGEIRAMASAPEFSQNNPSESLENEDSPFINRAVTPYSVGSVFKPVVAAAATENSISADYSYECTGSYRIGKNVFKCHKRQGHGEIDMYGAMINSCNPYFIDLALNVGKERICQLGADLGLGKQIEICDGWYSAAGIMPSVQDIVSPQDLANLAFGQGTLLASPLQMAAVYAAFANGGVYCIPSLMKSVIDENGDEILHAGLPAQRRVMHEETAKQVGELLYKTVELGSSGKARSSLFRSAGKTSTAQSGQFDSDRNEITHSWFCGYFPYEQPQYSVAVFKEDGTGGTADCAPVFRYIAEKISETN